MYGKYEIVCQNFARERARSILVLRGEFDGKRHNELD